MFLEYCRCEYNNLAITVLFLENLQPIIEKQKIIILQLSFFTSLLQSNKLHCSEEIIYGFGMSRPTLSVSKLIQFAMESCYIPNPKLPNLRILGHTPDLQRPIVALSSTFVNLLYRKLTSSRSPFVLNDIFPCERDAHPQHNIITQEHNLLLQREVSFNVFYNF